MATSAIITVKDSNGNSVTIPALRGPQGIQGLKGDTGAQGPQGERFAFKGIYTTLDNLKLNVTSPNAGDMYLVGGGAGQYNIYMYDTTESAQWKDLGPTITAIDAITDAQIDALFA